MCLRLRSPTISISRSLIDEATDGRHFSRHGGDSGQNATFEVLGGCARKESELCKRPEMERLFARGQHDPIQVSVTDLEIEKG